MPRRKLSEHKAKQLVTEVFEAQYVGWCVTPRTDIHQILAQLDDDTAYVVKVDQAVKGRFKKGLVLLDVEKAGIEGAVNELAAKGYVSFLIEQQVAHDMEAERYLSLMQDRQGLRLSWSARGGVDIESHSDSIQSTIIDSTTDWETIANSTGLTTMQLQALVHMFAHNYLVFLEINPYVVDTKDVKILDAAIEVDDAGAYFTHAWTGEDIRYAKTSHVSDEELTVRALDANSPASFNLSLLNPQGSVFLLLSGGGASVVVADEVYNQGYGKQLANYGEYSGNPNQEEAQLYTAAVLQLLLKSKAKKKVLFIGGAVANFTDIANTFAGVIAAIDKVADELRVQGVKVFVRRGGPRQEIGLAKIEACLQRHGILGAVHSPETPLTDVVAEALMGVAK